MSKHTYIEIFDGICYKGIYIKEDGNEGCNPIFTLETLSTSDHIDLMLVIDPRVIQEIEQILLKDYLCYK
jgi:hypothetical protein